MEISYTHIPPSSRAVVSEEYYRKGWDFADDALKRHGAEVCNRMRKSLTPVSSYEQGAADRWDDKPHRYGKDNT